MVLSRRNKRSVLLLALVLVLVWAMAAQAGTPAVRNVILLIGDGMGIAQITAARIEAESPDGILHLDTIKTIGLAKTHSASNLVTDSAAGATALATGMRTSNGRIGTDSDNRPLMSLMLLARDRGMGTGVAVTKDLTDATPASFLAQAVSRTFDDEIAEKIIHSGVNVLLGGGSETFGAHPFTRKPRAGSLLNRAIELGYLYIDHRDQLLALEPGESQNLLGLFSTGNLSHDRERFPTEPSLAEMTETALELLDAYPQGFFLLVEGSTIDTANHYNNTEQMLGDTIAFDQAVGVALNYARSRDDTLVVVTADHETGGLGITGGSPDGARVNHAWLSTDHTGTMVPVYAYGPGEEIFAGTQHLTDVSRKIARLLGFEPFPVYLDEANSAAQAPEHVVLIIVDGFDPHYFSFGLPNMEAFAQEGVWVKEAETIMPAATTAAMTSIITGSYPKTHGVPNNVYYDPVLNVRRESPRDVSVPNIGELFQAEGLFTVSINHFMMDQGADVQITGGWNTVNSRLKSELPDLLVFIEQTPDAVGHQRGAQSQEIAGSMKRVDRNFGKLIETMKDLGIYENSLVILTADHGMTHIEEGKRLGDALTNALAIPGLKMQYLSSGMVPDLDTDLLWFHMVTGAAIVYRSPIISEQEEILIRRLASIEGVHSVWDRERIAREGMHPAVADLWVNLADGYGLASVEMGGHASIFQQSVPLIMKGPGIKEGLVIEADSNIRTIDIVPTVLHMMGFDIPETVDGRVLSELGVRPHDYPVTGSDPLALPTRSQVKRKYSHRAHHVPY